MGEHTCQCMGPVPAEEGGKGKEDAPGWKSFTEAHLLFLLERFKHLQFQ